MLCGALVASALVATASAAQQAPVDTMLNATLQQDKARLLELARERSASRDGSVQQAEERIELWKQVMLIDPNDVEARLGYQEAQKDLDTARQRAAEEQKTTATADASKREKLLTAERALYARDLNGAESILNDVLAQSPDDPRALSLKQAVTQARRMQVARRRFMAIAGALVAVAALLGIVIKKRQDKKKESGGAEPKAGGAQPAGGTPLIKVVDGVGRGRIVPVTGDIFRIGAAKSDQPEENNHLIISDAGAFISRHHCTIIRKGKKYVLVDSSLNGTLVNGRALERGEHRDIRDGDEIALAEVSRLKFLMT